jgi:hypothetical protein
MAQFIAPTGYVDLDNDCEFSIDRKSTRSREEVNPKEDLAFYFNTYIVPKYGLNNINVSNVASFMKELEMNWTKLSPSMRDQVMDILVDGILNRDSSFKSDLLNKLGVREQINVVNTPSVSTVSTFGNNSRSRFGSGGNNKQVLIFAAIAAVVVFMICKNNKKPLSYGRLS